MRQVAPNAVVLAETWETPQWRRWLRRAAKLWKTAARSAPDSFMHQALATTTQLAAANTTLSPACRCALQP